MTAINQDFSLWIGNKAIIQIDTNVDLTGATVEWALKKAKLDTEAAILKDTSDGIAITNEAAGVFEVTLEDTDTENLEEHVYHHEARIYLGGTDGPYTVTVGKVSVYQSLF